MKTKLFTGVAFAAMMLPAAAFAQSTGSVDMDQGDVVVTAARPTKGISGVQIPDGTKARGVLSQEFIAKQTPGNSILDTINMLPGVSFQNNDPFGSAGGTLSIRGFDSSRIALTFDGVPLNDTGNYALYSNQQLDPELIEQVNVSYGSTDVDSPSAAASGSTVNYRTIVPTDKFGARFLGSVGDYDFFRVFGLINTGEFTSIGTKAWISASSANNRWFVNDFGKINKSQFNARIYQPLGSNGDFLSLSGNYNVNRNNFGGSAPLRVDTTILNAAGVSTGTRTPGTVSAVNRFPISRDELPYHVARCTVNTGNPGVADTDTSSGCGTTFDERYNPSNTGNVRFGSKFTLAPSLVLTVDASYQYVKANGGGVVQAREGLRDVNPAGGTASTSACALAPTNATNSCVVGFFGGAPYAGKDLNGDGDTLDIVNVLS
ncbi:MAG TPA: TonB-dependent receptor plug domain-containing protein, partial [Sphingomonas sp.]|nr:TonB-dependent receptor plug domain-containing protein [Sphingomonas sp.]